MNSIRRIHLCSNYCWSYRL